MIPSYKQLTALAAVFAALCVLPGDARAEQTGVGVGTDELSIGFEITKNKDDYIRHTRIGTGFGGGLAYAMDFMGKTSPYLTNDLASYHVVIGGGFGTIVNLQSLDYSPGTLYASPIVGTTAQFQNIPLEATLTYRVTPVATLISGLGPVTFVDYFGVTGHIHLYF